MAPKSKKRLSMTAKGTAKAPKRATKAKRLPPRSAKPAAKSASKNKSKKVQPVPAGYPAVIAGFAVPHCDRAVEFLKTVFGAKVMDLMKMTDGTIAHCDLQIGESRIMCGEPMGPGGVQTLRAMLFVKNCDAVFAKALAAGATLKEPLKDQFYGDRSGRVLDPCGNEYIIATHVEDVSKAEMDRRMQAMMKEMASQPALSQPVAQA